MRTEADRSSRPHVKCSGDPRGLGPVSRRSALQLPYTMRCCKWFFSSCPTCRCISSQPLDSCTGAAVSRREWGGSWIFLKPSPIYESCKGRHEMAHREEGEGTDVEDRAWRELKL